MNHYRVYVRQGYNISRKPPKIQLVLGARWLSTSKDSKFTSFKFIIYKHGKWVNPTTITPLGLELWDEKKNILEQNVSCMDHMIALLHLPLHTFRDLKLVSHRELHYYREEKEKRLKYIGGT